MADTKFIQIACDSNINGSTLYALDDSGQVWQLEDDKWIELVSKPFTYKAPLEVKL